MPKTTQLSVTDCRLTFFSAIFSLSHSENLTRPSLSQVAPMLQMRAKENQGSISSLRRASCSSVIGFSPWKKMSGTLRHQQSLVVITFHEWEITNNFEWMSACIDKVSSILQLSLWKQKGLTLSPSRLHPDTFCFENMNTQKNSSQWKMVSYVACRRSSPFSISLQVSTPYLQKASYMCLIWAWWGPYSWQLSNRRQSVSSVRTRSSTLTLSAVWFKIEDQ